MTLTSALLGFVALALGAALGYLLARSRAAAEAGALQAELASSRKELELERGHAAVQLAQLDTRFRQLSSDILEDKSKRFTYGFNGGAFIGVRWRLVSAESRLSAHFDATYQALVIASGLGSDDDATAINSGSSDLFHGPTLSLGGAF